MLTSLFRQKRFSCEVTSTSTEKLSSPCHNRWFDTVSTNLGTSLGFDHNNEKNVRFLTLAAFTLWKNYFTEGRCRLAWRVLTPTKIVEVNPMKFLSNVLKTLSTLNLHAEKKRQIPNGILKHFIH